MGTKKKAVACRPPFSFEAEARIPGGMKGIVSVWTDDISFSVELPQKGFRNPPGVPAFIPTVGRRYRVTIEELP